jgi:hypothetical protein
MANVEVVVRTTEQGSQNLKKLETGLKNIGGAADQTAIRTAALGAKQDYLGRQVAKGNLTLGEASKQYGVFRTQLDKASEATVTAAKKQGVMSKALEFASNHRRTFRSKESGRCSKKSFCPCRRRGAGSTATRILRPNE